MKVSKKKPYSATSEHAIEKEVKSIINECAEITRKLVRDYKDKIQIMAEELLKKETLDLDEIIQCLGDRPYPMPSSIKDYLDEVKKRKVKEEEEEKKKQNESNEGKNSKDEEITINVEEGKILEKS